MEARFQRQPFDAIDAVSHLTIQMTDAVVRDGY